MSNKLIIIIGFPASGKSTYALNLHNKTLKSVIISRDDKGGNTIDLLPYVKEELTKGKTVILDNTNLTKKVRKPFIELGKLNGVQVHAIHIRNMIEDSQVKALHRMFEMYGKIYLTGKPCKNDVAHTDAGVFPPAVLFSARKHFEEPNESEGFDKITIIDAIETKWDGRRYRNKAIFFDIDGTLRKTEHLPLKYPVETSQVELLYSDEIMKKKLETYIKEGYKLVGISNQSGIAKKTISENQVVACMEETRKLLGLTEKDMPIMWCPHSPAPIVCYCRKPQVGMIMHYVETLKLNPKKCIVVGDSKVDETSATRMQMKFIHANQFWV
jgi:HAD superfamily hydrolase (TIGR01662 family)